MSSVWSPTPVGASVRRPRTKRERSTCTRAPATGSPNSSSTRPLMAPARLSVKLAWSVWRSPTFSGSAAEKGRFCPYCSVMNPVFDAVMFQLPGIRSRIS